ncbi:hypothetical protein [Paenibacillus cremeus]|uniref:EamA domain-containing protein n=1 Tax=Paenibacillus cremeus TaxID=2163881 RepID=A0A559KD71_9BACL|nr:hypothetical protein [Paenibacillus cremeus]TVY10081.1 hypothetical protein FPZ49_10175 [Paenibacillus cremeus]
MIKYLMLFGSLSLTVVANTLLKMASKSLSFEGGIVSVLLGYLSSQLIIGGFAAYALAAVVWVYCLSAFDLSYVTFVSSVQYILIIAVSILVFQEQISMMKWSGCAFIMIGVIFWMKG